MRKGLFQPSVLCVYIYILCLLIYNPIPSIAIKSKDDIVFLDRSFSAEAWTELTERLHCYANHGEWQLIGRQDPRMYPFACGYQKHNHSRNCLFINTAFSEGLKYRWLPHDKCFHHGHTFLDLWTEYPLACSLLKDLHLLVLGDSLSDEFYTTLRSYIRQSVDYLCDECTHNCRGDDVRDVNCTSGATMSSISLDDAILTNEVKEIIVKQSINLIIINSGGVHFKQDQYVLRSLNETFSYLMRKHPKVSVVYRSTSPAHPSCASQLHSPPLFEYPNYEAYRYSLQPGPLNATEIGIDLHDPARSSYSTWSKFYAQNSAVRDFLARHFPHIVFLDVYPSTFLRPDRHVSALDCLHYCMPGPIDNWVVLFFNALRAIREK